MEENITTNDIMRRFKVMLTTTTESPTTDDAVHSAYLAFKDLFDRKDKLPFVVQEIEEDSNEVIREHHIAYRYRDSSL